MFNVNVKEDSSGIFLKYSLIDLAVPRWAACFSILLDIRKLTERIVWYGFERGLRDEVSTGWIFSGDGMYRGRAGRVCPRVTASGVWVENCCDI